MPTSKENEVLVATPEAPANAPGAFRPDETSSRPSPVALEVPVTVNGARTVEGSDKREPFSETTKTVLVFGNGAVIRLSSPVAAGQLLFLTNEKTKKEVVCQVVKSKNYRSVSGYVELEFTESVVGFWGMRFPTDRIAAPTTTTGGTVATAAKPNAVASALGPKAPDPAAVPAKATELKPMTTPAPPAPAAPQATQRPIAQVKAPAPVAPAHSTPVAKAPEAHNTPTIASSLASSVASLLGSPEVPPAATPKAPGAQESAIDQTSATRAGEPSTEQLKQQAARLQEQLSSMLFGAAGAANQKPGGGTGAETAVESKAAPSPASKVLEMARPEPLAPPKLTSSSKPAVPPVKSSLDAEEVKIPSWLEPLARNAAAPASTQELVEREKARHAAEMTGSDREEVKPEPLPLTAEAAPSVSAAEPETQAMPDLLPLEDSLSQPAETGSKRGLWIGIAAAAVLAAAGGGWYFLHPTNGASNGPAQIAQNVRAAVPATNAAAPAIQPPATPTPSAQSSAPAAQPPSRAITSEPLANAPVSAPINAQPVPLNRETRGSGAAVPAASTERIARSAPVAPAAAKPEAKKPSLGEIHLTSPTVSRSTKAGDDGLAAPAISSSTEGPGAGLGSELVPNAAGQPDAPKAALPIGGDVKPAKLLNSTSPIYPALAKTQHVSGDISIDALIDPNGRVTTMKVLSGPTLLRQAAMDAVRQWKYQPATLDGNAVAMHLTVTVQFRIQ